MKATAITKIVVDVLMTLARRLHILGAYWGFILMSVHPGLHWNLFWGMAKKKMSTKNPSKMRKILLRLIGILIAAYGAFVLISRDFTTYLFLQSEFVFLDYDEPVWSFYLDYICFMGLWIFAAHYLSKGLRKFGSVKKAAAGKENI